MLWLIPPYRFSILVPLITNCRGHRNHRSVSLHLVIFARYLLSFGFIQIVAIVEDFHIFHIIPDCNVYERAECYKKRSEEVQRVAKGLSVVKPTVASSSARFTPNDASSEGGGSWASDLKVEFKLPVKDVSKNNGARDHRKKMNQRRPKANRNRLVIVGNASNRN